MTQAAPAKAHLTREHVQALLKSMLRIRRFEEKCAELYTLEKIRGFLHLYIGEEAIAVGVMPALLPTDAVVATYAEAQPGAVCALFGSSDHLEVAVNGASAAERLELGRGARVTISRA